MNTKRPKRRRKKTAAKKVSYVSRPSQITKAPPTRRLRRRRKKNVRAPKKGYFPNPQPLRYLITAQAGKGPRMHYDGSKFSQRARVKLFTTMDAAETKARELLRSFPILRRYQIRIESNRP